MSRTGSAFAALVFALLCCSCNPSLPNTQATPGDQVLINGTGATFPYPIYSKWFDHYHRLHPKIQINYQSLGSGAGIRQMIEGTVDFGASDGPMTEEQLKLAKNKILHFPTVLGADVVAYNIPGITQDINFTPEAIAGIFLGKITNWSDPELRNANPGLNLPDKEVIVSHRSDASGTTFVWTDYLSKVSPEWKSSVGWNTSVDWPVGLGAKGNEGVSGFIKQTPNSVGYLELVYAVQNKMAYGRVRNKSGVFVKADLATITAAAASASMPPDFRVSITNSPGADAYPISSFTWLLIPSKIADPVKKDTIRNFLHWMLEDGQSMVESLSYAKLPREVAAMEEKAIDEID